MKFSELDTDQQWAQLSELVDNMGATRSQLFRSLLEPRRNIDAECGYPTAPLPAWDWWTLHTNNAIAARVNEMDPLQSWVTYPVIEETPDGQRNTPFEEGLQELAKALMGQGESTVAGDPAEESWYEPSEESNPLWDELQRLDTQAGIGQYGVMLLGFGDGETDLTQPVTPKKGMTLDYTSVFPECMAEITSFENDKESKRYGLPKTYNLKLNDPRVLPAPNTGIGLVTSTLAVHWSRVIHFADNIQSCKWAGFQRCRQVLKQVLNCNKVYSSSAEGYWKACFTAIALETHPSLGGDVKVNRTQLKNMMEDFWEGLQRSITLMGMSAKTLAPQVVDPTAHIDKQIEAICIKYGWPVRIFMGSERGELASSQDDGINNERIMRRNNRVLTTRMIVPLINRLIWAGCVPQPKQFRVHWAPLDSMSAQEKAAIALTRTQALAAYMSGGVDAVVPPFEYLTDVMGFENDVAENVLQAAEEWVDQKMEGEMEKQQAKIDAGLAPNPAERQPIKLRPGETLVPRDQVTNAASDQGCLLFDGFCLNCGGKGGKPGPCPNPLKEYKSAKGSPKKQGGKDDPIASKEEWAATKKQAYYKIANVPVPDQAKVEKMRAALERAKTDPKARAGGDARGSAASRRQRAYNLFKEFGGEEKGYIVCHETGLKMHWSTDPKLNPKGYPKFEQGKIFTACQGGGYQLPNLLPESFAANRSRNDKRVRKENSDGC